MSSGLISSEVSKTESICSDEDYLNTSYYPGDSIKRWNLRRRLAISTSPQGWGKRIHLVYDCSFLFLWGCSIWPFTFLFSTMKGCSKKTLRSLEPGSCLSYINHLYHMFCDKNMKRMRNYFSLFSLLENTCTLWLLTPSCTPKPEMLASLLLSWYF